MSSGCGGSEENSRIYSQRQRASCQVFLIIGSIVCGFLGLLCLPVVAIVSLGNMEIELPEIDKSMFNEAAS